MQKTAHTLFLEHLSAIGERSHKLVARIQAINDDLRQARGAYEQTVLENGDVEALEARIRDLEFEGAGLTRQRDILARGERTPTTERLAQAVIDENRGLIAELQVTYDKALDSATHARDAYLQAIAALGEIARRGKVLSREVQQAAGYLPPPKPFIALHEPITGNRLTVDAAQFKNAYEGQS